MSGTQNQYGKFFAIICIRIIFQSILSCNYTGFIVITQIVTQIIIQLCRIEFFQHQFILQSKNHILCFLLLGTVREIFHKHLQLLDSLISAWLIQTWFRSIQEQGFTCMETCQFSESTTGISVEIGDKRLGSCLIIFLIIVTHTQHIQRLLRFIGSLKDCNQFVQQGSWAVILPFSKIVFGGLVLVFVIGTFQQLIVLSTRCQRGCCEQSYNDIFLHPFKKYCAKLLIRGELTN